MDPVTKENAGGCLGQPAGAQHAVTMALSIAETAFVHLPISIPMQTHGNICIGDEHMCPATLVCPTYTLDINPVLLCMSLRSQEKTVY